MNLTDFIVQTMFTSRKEEIITGFIDSGITDWNLSLDFILTIAAIVTDDAKLARFLSSIELNIDWLQAVFNMCFERRMFGLMIALTIENCGDYYLALIIAEYAQDFAKEHELLTEALVMHINDTVVDDCIASFPTTRIPLS